MVAFRMRTIHHELIELALSRVTGPPFEKFVQAVYAAMLGRDFVPIGGVHDGGADGAVLSELFESARPTEFLQVTVQSDHRSKIRQTVARLREFGRTVATLHYVTSKSVSNPDKEESELSDELECVVRIRDAKYLTYQVNNSVANVQAFDSYLAPYLDFLNSLGAATTISSQSANLPARALCVFIGQEIDRRSNNSQLLESLTDTLILWSLRDTDPATKQFRTRDEILSDIIGSLPASAKFIRNTIDLRLKELSARGVAGGRSITHWRKDAKYCLPYETRQIVARENAEDEALKLAVARSFSERIDKVQEGSDIVLNRDDLVDVCFRALEKIFELQGLEVSYFLTNDSDNDVRIVVSEAIADAIKEVHLPYNDMATARSIVLRAIQGAFYDSSDVERAFLSKLSRTYCLLFSLKSEPRIVEYFRGMSSNFILYVGSDLIIRAFSEHYLAKEDRMTENLFAILRAAGSTLVLTETALEEVHTHIISTDMLYRHQYMPIEQSIDIDVSRHISKILIRSYYYAKLVEGRERKPSNWGQYVEQFCSYDKLHREGGREFLLNYIREKFGMEYEDAEETQRDIDADALKNLTDALVAIRPARDGRERLAYNDALQVLRIYQKRKQIGENKKSNPFGYRTWWMTQETTVRRVTRDLVQQKGNQYIIRPEFLVNFIALNPNVADVKKSFADIFPSMLGVKLANRMNSSAFSNIIDKIKDAYGLEEARARSKLPELVDQLKADLEKSYDHELDDVDEELV